MLRPIVSTRIIQYLLLLLLLGSSLPAAAASDEELARAAVDALFRLEYDRTEQQIYILSERNPNHHMIKFLRAGILWLKAEAQQGYENLHPAWQQAAEAYEVAIQEAEAKLKENPDSPEWRLTLGLSQFFAARAYIGLSKITKIYHYARAGRDNLRILIKQHPDYYDAYVALGVYEYIAGSIPRSLTWLAYIFDISGDRDLGVKYLRLAASRGPVIAPEAARMLIAAAALQPEYVHDACQYLPLSREMLELYPQNPHLSGAYQMLHANCGYPQLALNENQRARKVYSKDFPDMVKALNIVELQTQRSLGNLTRLEQMRKLFKKRNTAYWHLAMGQYYDLQGQRKQALEHYYIIRNSDDPQDLDTPDVLSNSDNRDWLLDQVDLYIRMPFKRIEAYPINPETSLKLMR